MVTSQQSMMAGAVIASSEEAPPNGTAEPSPDLLTRCLNAGREFVSDLVRSLPPRAESPLRDLTLEQVDTILQMPDEGQSQAEFLAERALPEEEGRALLGSLVRRRLVVRTRRSGGPWICLSDRGRAARDRLNGIRRGLLSRMLDRLTPDRSELLAGLLGGVSPEESAGWGSPRDGAGESASDQILNRLLHLRRGLASWFGLPGPVGSGFHDLTLHQREALLRMPADGLTMREFASGLGISHGSATALADRLVARGLVDREADPTDRRVVRLVPTVLGQQLAESFREAQLRAISDLLQGMDQHQLDALAQVADLLAGERAGGLG